MLWGIRYEASLYQLSISQLKIARCSSSCNVYRVNTSVKGRRNPLQATLARGRPDALHPMYTARKPSSRGSFHTTGPLVAPRAAALLSFRLQKLETQRSRHGPAWTNTDTWLILQDYLNPIDLCNKLNQVCYMVLAQCTCRD